MRFRKKINSTIKLFDSLTDAERTIVMDGFCSKCGAEKNDGRGIKCNCKVNYYVPQSIPFPLTFKNKL